MDTTEVSGFDGSVDNLSDEGITPALFKEVVGKLAYQLSDRLRAGLSPMFTGLEEEARENPDLRYKAATVRRSKGFANALSDSLPYLGQRELRSVIQAHARNEVEGRSNFATEEEAARYYSERIVIPFPHRFQEGVSQIGKRLEDAMIEQHDPSLQKASSSDRNSEEALKLAEITGRVNGFVAVLEQLSPDTMTRAQAADNPRFKAPRDKSV